jgi:alpha-tubulin suppressor-like RCC1 family protein
MNFIKRAPLAVGLMMLSLVLFTTGCGSTTSVGTSGGSATTVKVTQIASRNNGTHSLFLKSDGTVWATGSNTTGQLGDGTTTVRLTPVKVPSF